MTKINENFLKLPNNYLFAEVANRVEKYKQENPDKEVLKLGIGDVTKPLPKTIVKDLGITQITDEAELLKIITEVIKENQHQVEQYKNQPKVLDYFIGQTMKKTRGKANPSLTSKLLKQELDKQ